MRVIHKYGLPDTPGVFEWKLPKGAMLLDIQSQDRSLGTVAPVPCLWALVDTLAEIETVRIQCVATGDEAPDGSSYIGTCQCGPMVWHYFDADAETRGRNILMRAP